MPRIEIPEEYLCPITSDVLRDPVTTVDGNTYEREAIEQWLANHNTSPITNLPLASKTLTPNFFAKKLIKQFLEKSQVITKEIFFEHVKAGTVKKLVELNYIASYVNAVSDPTTGFTPLHYSASYGMVDVAEWLIKQGAYVEAQDAAGDHKGNTPLIWAACRNRVDVVKLLLDNKADIHNHDKQLWTALHWAASCDSVAAAEMLCKHGANVNFRNAEGDTPIHIAARKGYQELVKLLISHGADLKVKNNVGKTVAEVSPYTVQMLIDALKNERKQQKKKQQAEMAEQLKKKEAIIEQLRLENAVLAEKLAAIKNLL